MMVNRALLMAESGSPGPTYITAARETLAAPAGDTTNEEKHKVPQVKPCLPTDHALIEIGDALLLADRPIVITGYLGRCTEAFHSLIRLADLVRSLKVIDSEFRETSFPATHPAWTTMTTGGQAAIESADVILVLDSDVPWIPTRCRPSLKARIFHIDLDVTKKKMQLFDIFAEISFNASSGLAVDKINEYIYNRHGLAQRQPIFEQRWLSLKAEHAARMRTLAAHAVPRADGSISSDHLFATLRQILPNNTTYVHDAVTNTIALFEQLQLTRPGTAFGKGGSGLGWAGGAAIGISLAMRKYETEGRPSLTARDSRDDTARLIVSITGDGGFMFGSPGASYWAQHRLKTPFLTIVLNNGGWRATRFAGVDDEAIGYDLTKDAPDYVGIAIAASNGNLWGKRISDVGDLQGALQTAVRVVMTERRGALLEVVIS